jgi:hypothetical protein
MYPRNKLYFASYYNTTSVIRVCVRVNELN